MDVFDPKGERVFSLAEAATAQNIQFTSMGFYDIRRPNGRNELVAVNADRRESDLAPAPPETLRLWQNTASGIAVSGQAAAAGQSRLSLLATDHRAARFGGAFSEKNIHVVSSATLRARNPLALGQTAGLLGLGFWQAWTLSAG